MDQVSEPWIARIGQSQQFLATMGHIFVPAFILSVVIGKWCNVSERHRIYIAIIGNVIALFKEYWYDATYEKDPPQTFWDNTEDFITWTIGFWLGALV